MPALRPCWETRPTRHRTRGPLLLQEKTEVEPVLTPRLAQARDEAIQLALQVRLPPQSGSLLKQNAQEWFLKHMDASIRQLGWIAPLAVQP